MKRKLTLLAAVVAALLLGLSTSAHANGYTYFEHGFTGHCVDDPFNSTTNGTTLQLWQCHAVTQEYWNAVSLGGGYYKLQLQNGKCLDDPFDSPYNGAVTQIWTCNGDNAQKWYFNAYPNGAGYWENVNNAVCVDDTGNSDANGNPIQVWGCNQLFNQTWYGPGAN